MKVCPVCSARCFDDMDVCYGCMHRFEEAPEPAEAGLGTPPGSADVVGLSPASNGLGRPAGGENGLEAVVATFAADSQERTCARWELVVSLRPMAQGRR